MRGNKQMMTQAVVDSPILFGDLRIDFLCITYDVKAPKSICQTHVHDYFEFYLILEGCQYTTINGIEQLNGGGRFFFVPPGVQHSHRYCGEEGDRGIVVRFSLDKVKSSVPFAPIADRVIQTLSVPHATAFADQRIDAILTNDTNLSPDRLQLSMVDWVLRLCELLDEDSEGALSRMPPRAMTDKELVDNVIVSIGALYMTDVDVNRLAMMHNISYRHLSRLFLNITKRTLTEWITSMRIYHSMILLDETDFSINDISRHVGFQSESYFSNVFKRVTGMAPSRYRKGKPTPPGTRIPLPIPEFFSDEMRC